jgi:hypothetical protein
MGRITITVVVIGMALGACTPTAGNEGQQLVPLPVCDWPIPGGLRLHIEELSGHSYSRLKEDGFGQRATFQPLPKELATRDFQSSDAGSLSLVEEIGPARIFSLRLFLTSETGQEAVDADVDAYTILLGKVMVTTAGFTLPEVRAMILHCIESRRE